MKAEIIPSLCAGGDLDVANAARRSFNTQHQDLTEADIRLLHFLAHEGHMLPFRHPQLSFACEAPVYVARQLGKHQVGMSWSEVSRRYKTGDISFFTPARFRHDCQDRKQGTGQALNTFANDRVQSYVRQHQAESRRLYEYLLTVEHVAPEQARGVLPQDMDVLWTWTGSLLAWAHLWKLRNHTDTQQETRAFVRLIAPQIEDRLPHAWSALTDER